MNVLILEDDPNRIGKFKRELIGHNVSHTDQVDLASSWLSSNNYDLIFLDHDLGGAHYVSSEEYNCGYTFAKFLAEFLLENRDLSPYVLIHSCNHGGAANMYSRLVGKCNVVVQPFVGLDIQAVVGEAQRVKEYHEAAKDD